MYFPDTNSQGARPMYTHTLPMRFVRALFRPGRAVGAVLALTLITGACEWSNSPVAPPVTPPAASVAPTVTITSPTSAAVGINRSVSVTATFSKAMNAATINATTFTLFDGLVAVPAVVTYAGSVATLNPVGTLGSNTVYTAHISEGARDLQGDSLATPKVWSFTTLLSSITGPPVVNLGTAGNFVILAKSGVSTTGVTSVVGDIGLSPAAASLLTGFAMSAPPTTFTTSALVTGQLFASNFDPPTPAMLTAAVLDMQTAFTDAAGRTLPDFVNLGAGNIQGMTLVPGLYKWGTGLQIPSAVTLSGGANDVWIFQIAQNLTVGNGAIVTLSGGAQAKNVFWQVSGAATLGTTANFKGI